MDEDEVEHRIDGMLGKYDPAMARRLRDARAWLRGHFPRGFELVFDNYNALVFGIGPSERTNESFISIAGYPKWVTLFFLNGATLDDSTGLLQGSGKQVRGIRLTGPALFASPEVESLVGQAMRPHVAALGQSPALTTVVKLVVGTQRPRRPPLPTRKRGRADAG